MKIGFIEDTHLRGGTQIWVIEATRDFIAKGEEVAVIAPEGSHVANLCAEAGATIHTYDWDDIVVHPEKYKDLLVRVATYSAYFVELSPELQNDIINRMEFQDF